MRKPHFTTGLRSCATALGMLLISGCGSLLHKAEPPPQVYSLESAPELTAAITPLSRAASALTVIINPPRAAPGYDSQHIVYVELAHERKYFAHNEWVAPPARMLLPIMIAALVHTGSFRAVAPMTSGIAGDLRLDSEILRLQHEFGSAPSRVRFTLRVTLSDTATRQVLASREFEKSVASAHENPYGGVVAANRAVQEVTAQVASYCAQVAASWRAENHIAPRLGGQRSNSTKEN